MAGVAEPDTAAVQPAPASPTRRGRSSAANGRAANGRAADGRARPRADRRGTISQRLNYLFETVHAPGQRPFKAAAVARGIRDAGGKISDVYILKLLNGERSEPTLPFLRDLAGFFGVPLSFFTDDDPPEVDGPALAAAIQLRDQTFTELMTKISLLSSRSQRALADIVDSLLHAEGKHPS